MQDGSVSPIKSFFRNKWVWLVFIIDIAIVVFIASLSVNKATETATINFNIVPADVTITINGSDDYKNNGPAYSLSSGTYEIQISHPDLDSKTLTVNLEANRNLTITTFLSKDNDFYYYTLYGNYGNFYKLTDIASAQNNQTTDHDTSAETFIKNYQEQYNLYTTELPIEYRESSGQGKTLRILKNITIRAKYNCAITLCVEALAAGTDSKEFINSLLEEKGFNVKELEIEYKFY